MPKVVQPNLNYIGEFCFFFASRIFSPRNLRAALIRAEIKAAMKLEILYDPFDLLIYFLFAAPEVQHKSVCSISSDMFSFGMLMVAVFNNGHSLIQANHNATAYFKQAGTVSDDDEEKAWERK